MKIQLVFDEQKRGEFDVNGPAEIYKALRAQNIRSEILLFDRAIDMCFERKFDDAEILIQSLLLLHPRDKIANTLLIKILAAQKKFDQARQEIQKAKGRGTQIPSNIRMYVEEGIKREDIKKQNEIVQIVNKEKQKEEDLRKDIKKLRREREMLQNENLFLSEQTKKWYLIASCIAGFGLFVIIAMPYMIQPSEQPNTIEVQKQKDDTIHSKTTKQNSNSENILQKSSPKTEKIKAEKIKAESISKNTSMLQNSDSVENSEPKNQTIDQKNDIPSPNTSNQSPSTMSSEQKDVEPSPKYSETLMQSKKTNTAKHTEQIQNQNNPNPSSKNVQFPFTYVVQKGDTLDKIAERYYGRKSEWKKIAENNDVSPRNLQIGQKLIIVAP